MVGKKKEDLDFQTYGTDYYIPIPLAMTCNIDHKYFKFPLPRPTFVDECSTQNFLRLYMKM